MALGPFKNNYRGFTYQVECSETQDNAANCSKLKCTHKLIISSGYSLKISKRTNSCVINGSVKTFDSAAINASKSSSDTIITLGTTNHTISHDVNGKGKFTIHSTFNIKATISGIGVDTIVVSGEANLTSISRASTFGTITGNTIGEDMTVNIARSNTSYTHQLWYKMGNSKWFDVGSKLTTSVTFTPTNDLKSQLPNSTNGTLQLRLRTYNGATQIGSDVYKNITVYLKGIAPTIGEITLTPQKITIGEGKYGILVQGKSKLDITVSDCSAGEGSSIRSYTFSGPGIWTNTTTPSVTTNIIPDAGTLTYTVTVTDNRGCSTSKVVTIESYPYFTPYFRSFGAYRCTADIDDTKEGISQFINIKEDNVNGKYIRCEYELTYASLGLANALVNPVKIYGGTQSIEYSSFVQKSIATDIRVVSGYAMIKDCDLSKTYNIYVTAEDLVNGKTASGKVKIFGASKIMNVRSTGNGIAFGKMSETANVLDSVWPIKSDDPANTMQNLSYRTPSDSVNSTTADTVQNWANQGNLATVYYASEKLTNQPQAHGFLLNLTNGPGNTEIHHIWAGQGSRDVDRNIYHRCGNSNAYGNWIKILDEKNIGDVVADYVVEQNTIEYSAAMVNGILYPGATWTYRKWKSGFTECFASYDISNHGYSRTWKSLYVHECLLPLLPFTFTQTPRITTSWQGSAHVIIGGIEGCNESACGEIHFYRPDDGNVTGTVVLTVTGMVSE